MATSYLDLPKAADGLSLEECSRLGKEILGTTLFILMKKNYFGSDDLVGFCVFCDFMLFYCVIFLSMQTRTNGFVLLVSIFLCIIIIIIIIINFFFHLGSCCEIIYNKTDCRNVGSQLV